MKKTRIAILVASLCVAVSLASAKSIPITGAGMYGFAETEGDFSITGSGVSLSQGLPEGPSFIGLCTIGAMCNLSWSPATGSSFCSYCLYYSGGTFNGQTAEYLDNSLTFKGSAFYTGSDTLAMNFTVHGWITGYELVNCDQGVGCSLGPELFNVYVSGHGTEYLTMNTGGVFRNQVQIVGTNATFTGALSTSAVPEPVTLTLIGTGLLGVWIKKRKLT